MNPSQKDQRNRFHAMAQRRDELQTDLRSVFAALREIIWLG